VKLLLDEMWDQNIAEQLRKNGRDVMSVRERPDLRMMGDDVVFAAAQMEGRAIVTENHRDFRPLAQRALLEGRSHYGLILTDNRSMPRARPGTLGRMVRQLIALLEAETDVTNREIWLR
jgi:predicted nuclease of predicted toxin-antitoxin system